MLIRAFNREVYVGPWNPRGDLPAFGDWMVGFERPTPEERSSLVCQAWFGPWHLQLCGLAAMTNPETRRP